MRQCHHRGDSDVERGLKHFSSVIHIGAAPVDVARDVDTKTGVAEAPVGLHDAVRNDANETGSVSTFHRGKDM